MGFGSKESWRSHGAKEAEAEGRFPLGRVSKLLGVPAGAIRDLCPTGEWHHVGMFAAEVPYYDSKAVAAFFGDDHGKALLEDWKRGKKSLLKGEPMVFPGCEVGWLEWGGTRGYPVAKEVRHEKATVLVFPGKTQVSIVLQDGKTVRKRWNGRGMALPEGVLKACQGLCPRIGRDRGGED